MPFLANDRLIPTPGLLHLLFHLLKSPCIVSISHRSSSKSPSLALCVKSPSLLHYHHFLHPALLYHSNYPTREAYPGPQPLKGKTLTLFCLAAAAAAAKSLQSYPTLCDPIDGSPPGSPAPGILQARTLEWVAIAFSNAWKWKVKVKSLSRVRLPVTSWTAAHQAPLSVGFSRQEDWSGEPLPAPFVWLLDLKYKTASTINRYSASACPICWIIGVNIRILWDGAENQGGNEARITRRAEWRGTSPCVEEDRTVMR